MITGAPKRIAFPFSGQTVGGSHHSTLEIIKALDRAKYEPVIVLHDDAGPLATLLRAQDLTFEKLPPGFLSVLRFIKSQKINAVHLDNGPLRLFWLPAAKIARISYIHFQRTLVLRGHFEKRLSYALCDAVISNSKQTQQSLPPLPARIKQAVSYPVISLAQTPRNRSQNPVPVVGYVANMRPEKRPLVFIEAAKILKNSGLRARYVMVGGFFGDEENIIKTALEKAGLADDFTFTGAVADAQEYIAAFDLLLVPAMREAFGRVLVEAMGLGTPVIAADAGGHREIIEDGINGILIPVDDAAGFAAASRNVLEDSALRKRLIAGGLATAQKFAPETQIRAVMSVYDALLQF